MSLENALPGTIPVSHIAAALGVSRSTVYKIRRTAAYNGFPESEIRRIGRRVAFPRDEVTAWLERVESGDVDLAQLNEWVEMVEAQEDAA